MAVSIDTVYQRVLALANKEQRGYITPQEFNLFANQAQMEILNQYFYDIYQWGRAPGSNHEYADMLSIVNEKIAVLNVRELNIPVISGIVPIPIAAFKLGSVFAFNGFTQVEEVNYNEYQYMIRGNLTKPSLQRPVYINRIDGLNIYPAVGINNVNISYVKIPDVVQWAYVIVNDKALYNDNISVDFELHASEETELVYKILKLAGVNLKNVEIAQAALNLEQGQIQQEKQ